MNDILEYDMKDTLQGMAYQYLQKYAVVTLLWRAKYLYNKIEGQTLL